MLIQKIRKLIISKLSLQSLFQVIGLSLALVIFFQFRTSISEIKYETIKNGILTLSFVQVFQAIALTISSFLVLSYVEYRNYKDQGISNLTYRAVFFISWTSNSLSNYVSFAGLSGATTRLRLLKSWNVEIKKGLAPIILNSFYLWSGYSLLSFLAIVIFDLPVIKEISLPSHSRLILIVVESLALFLFGLVFLHPQPAHWIKNKVELHMPSFRFSLEQTFLTSIDWCISAAVLYILLPQSYALSFGTFLSIFLSAQLLALISHIPGGLGIVEAFIMATHQGLNSTELLGPLVFYRIIFYLLPLGFALFSLLAFEIKNKSPLFSQSLSSLFGRLANLVPLLVAFIVFIEGLYLVSSDLIPLDPLKSLIFTSIIPVEIMNASYFYSSIAGLFLIVLAFGLYQKSNFSWFLTALTMSAALALSFLKGMRMVECSVLMSAVSLIFYFRSSFYRNARAVTHRFTPKWIGASVLMLIGLCGIFLVSRDHQFIIFVSILFVAVSVHWLGSPVENQVATLKQHRASDDIHFHEIISPAIKQSAFTTSQLAFLGDKRFFFNEDKSSFIMYSKRGRTWVAMGDPIGHSQLDRSLIQKFMSTADSFGCAPLFYQIRHDQLSVYHDLGFKLIKVGEEARVQLSKFNLTGRDKKSLRNAINRMEAEKVEFQILNPEQSLQRWPEMQSVSDAWLKKSGAKEKGFSLGFFSKSYQSHHSHAVLLKDGRVVAFANIWATEDKNELSVDLMRYSEEAPPGAIDCLFLKMILYGQVHGYTWFNLGMAPLAGLEESVTTPIWNIAGSFLYENGGRFYNFQGIRNFKEKFSPEWESRYIAVKTGFNVAGSIVDLTLLISETREKTTA